MFGVSTSIPSVAVDCFLAWVPHLCLLLSTDSSVDEHLDCFHSGPTLNNAAMSLSFWLG